MQTETQSSPSTSRMLFPHLLAAAAFIGSFVVIKLTGTNRTDADFYLGMVGYIATVCALMTTLAALILHPWCNAQLKEPLIYRLEHAISVEE